MKLKETHNPNDSFCFYCQKQFTHVANLNQHIKTRHIGTIAYRLLLKAEEEAMFSEIDKNDF